MRTLAQATWLNDEVISMWLGLLNVRTGVLGGFCPPCVDRGTDTALSTPSRMVGMGSTPAIYIEKFVYN